jgi:N-methylhydantoinase A
MPKEIEALTICFINAYINGEHERQAREIAQEFFPGLPISISSEVVPEMQEYERTETTVVNSYVRPEVARYVNNLQSALSDRLGDDTQLSILRSDGGLASSRAAAESPVNLLMSGPAGGVTGALFFCTKAGFSNILTFDMGGTSTDVALIQNGRARVRRETFVGDVRVRAPSVDVRTVGAGGGSIAPTVCDANVVLGYLPSDVQLGGDMQINRDASVAAVQRVADAMGVDLMVAAEGIIKIVNESMFGALRLVSVEQGYDPRDFALVGFGGAGPLHANALGILTEAWPVIVPPGPGVLCAYGDATTRVQDEAARTYITMASDLTADKLADDLLGLKGRASESLIQDGIAKDRLEVTYQADLRYAGQAFQITVEFTETELRTRGVAVLTDQFDAEHEQLFTFKLGDGHEILMIRAVVGASVTLKADITIPQGTGDVSGAVMHQSRFFYEGQWYEAAIFDRSHLGALDVIMGPAIVSEMDSTTVVLPGYSATVDSVGNLLIQPV